MALYGLSLIIKAGGKRSWWDYVFARSERMFWCKTYLFQCKVKWCSAGPPLHHPSDILVLTHRNKTSDLFCAIVGWSRYFHWIGRATPGKVGEFWSFSLTDAVIDFSTGHWLHDICLITCDATRQGLVCRARPLCWTVTSLLPWLHITELFVASMSLIKCQHQEELHQWQTFHKVDGNGSALGAQRRL